MRNFHGTVGPPELGSMQGRSIKLTHHTMKIDDLGGFRDLDLAQLNGVILALDWVRGDVHHIWGSAVMVGPGVALTARHVVDEMRSSGFLEAEGGYLLALGLHAHGLMLWNADSFTTVGGGDLAILTLVRATAEPEFDPSEHIPVNAATMALSPPTEGDVISLFGFKAAAMRFADIASEGAGLSLLGGVGPVLDLYHERGPLLGGPAASVGARTVGGMSGGGAFDAAGRLIGIISAGIGEDPSFISLAWPCVFAPLDVAWPPGLVGQRMTLHAMAQRDLCHIQGLELVEAHDGQDGTPLVSLRSALAR